MPDDNEQNVVNTPTPTENTSPQENDAFRLNEAGLPDYDAITAELEAGVRAATDAGRALAHEEAQAEEQAKAEAEREARKAEAEAAAKPKPQEDPAPQQAELVSPQLAILAKRERELRAARENLDAEISRRVAEQIEAYKAEIRKRALAAPSQFYREDLGVESTADYAADLWYAELGDEAPEEFKRKQQESRLQRKLAEMEARFEHFQKQQEQTKLEAERAAYVQGLQTQLDSLPDSLSFLKVEYSENPQVTLDALCQAAGNMIEATGQIPSPREVAEALNEEIGKLVSRYNQQQQVAQPETQAPISRPAVQTISSTQTSGRGGDSGEGWDKEAVIAEITSELERANRR